MSRTDSAALLCSLALGCSPDGAQPRPEWLVVVSSDASIPALGNRVLVEIQPDSGDCAGSCRRMFPLTSAVDLPLSFGVLPPGGSEPGQLRIRLFRDELLGPGGDPEGSTLIDLFGTLPPGKPEGVRELSAPLSMRCLGHPADLAAGTGCDPVSGMGGPAHELSAGSALLADSWAVAFQLPCTGPPPPGMVCVPGSAYLFGDPSPNLVADEESALPERLVVVSPFFLDERELSVGDYVLLAAAHSLGKPALRGAGGTPEEFCSFIGASSPDTDPLPLNCLTRSLAQEICAARGLRLPTEAEWELAAGNGSEETPFPWGDDPNACHYAVVGRDVATGFHSTCRTTSAGTVPPGPSATATSLDVSALSLRDLGGNVAEWTSDAFALRSAACWAMGAPALSDPICQAGDGTGRGTVRGGDWQSAPAEARASRRRAAEPNEEDARIGFRCALEGGAGH